jgi:hypothetical protein
MSNDRRRERQRHVRRLMRALTESEPVLITETGDIQEQPYSILPDSYQDLIAVRQQAYDALENQQRELLAQGRAGDVGDLGQRVHEAWTRTVEGVAYQLDLSFWVGENEHMEHIIYETVMRLPDDVRAFVFDRVTFLSAAWGQAFRGRDWSDSWVVMLAPNLPAEDATGIVAHEIAHAWRGHGEGRVGYGYSVDEEQEACALVQAWGFTGRGAVFEPPPDPPGGMVTYIN